MVFSRDYCKTNHASRLRRRAFPLKELPSYVKGQHVALLLACLFCGLANQALAASPFPAQHDNTPEQTGLCNGLDMSVTQDQLECADREFKSADKQLNGRYKRLMASLDSSQKAALKKEQIAWVKEKETKCAQENEEAGGGQLGTIATARCNVFMTEQRLAYLRKYK